MTTFTLDTHATIKELEAAGMESRQAEVVVDVISRADAEVATKQDIALLKQDIARVKQDLKQDIARVKANIWRVVLSARRSGPGRQQVPGLDHPVERRPP